MTEEQLQQLRYALEKFSGMTLTATLADAIVSAALFEPNRSIDPWQFEPEFHGDYRIAAEWFKDVQPELHRLHEQHWAETEKHRHGLPLNPDYDGMCAAERRGAQLQFTVRHYTALVGQLRMRLYTSMHSQTLVAEEDTLYLLPEHRGGFLAMHLIRYAERALRAVGVREIRANSKLVNRADVLMRRMKYQPVATQFVKVFGNVVQEIVTLDRELPISMQED